MAIDFKSLFSNGPTVREAGCPHRGAPHLNSNRRAEQPIVYFLKTECGCFMEPSPAGTGGTLLLGTSYHTLPRPPLRLQANEDLVPAMASSAVPFLDRGQGEVPAHLDGWYALQEGGCRQRLG